MSDLLERTLSLSFDRLGSGDSMLPFALVVGPANTVECLTIVTDRSDKAQYLGRRLVRERAPRAVEYAIATDAFVRQNDERLDAVIVEVGRRGEPAAYVVAQPFERSVGNAQRVGNPLPLGTRPSELVAWDPHSLHWGSITPDVYVAAQNLAVHVANHNFESDENVRRTVRFLRARIRHHAPHLPAGCSQLVHYDDRGQFMTNEARTMLARDVGVEVRFTSAGSA